MASTHPMKSDFSSREAANGARAWMIAMGFALTVLGVIALYLVFATTLISVFALGGLLIFSALFQFIFSFTTGKWSGFALHLLLAILYGVSGVLLISNPVIGAVSVTLFLGVLFLVSGIFRVVASLAIRFQQWGWALISGLVTSALGLYTLMNLPVMSTFFLGTIVAIDFLFLGFYLLAFGFSLKPLRGSSRPQGQFAHP